MTSSKRTYSARNGADVDLIFGADRVATAAEALPGDVILSRTGSFLTVTAPGRFFLGEHIVDYVTDAGVHGTIHFRADVPVMIYRPAETCSCGLYDSGDEPGHTTYDCVPAPCSYTGCSGHYRALGLESPVWCDVHAGLGEALIIEPRRYAVTVNVRHARTDGWASEFQLPTFYLDAATQGIVAEEHAVGIARTIVDNMHVDGATYSITAVAL